MIRLNKFIANAGVASRRHADDLIITGQVKVNHQVVIKLGSQIDPEHDLVEIGGKSITHHQTPIYFLVNKPRGVLSTTSDPSGKSTVISLVPATDRIYPVGRLDADSEGLMLLTNDGDLAYHLTHPKFHHSKTYHVLINGSPTTKTLDLLAHGTKLKSGRNRPDSLSVLAHLDGNTWLAITIHQGHKHQIRRLIAGVNHHVLRLIRVQLGPFTIDDLKGKPFRQLLSQEVTAKLVIDH